MNKNEVICKECGEPFEQQEFGESICTVCKENQELKLMEHLHKEVQ